MDLQISVFLLFILFTAGHSLSCYECKGLTGSCADQKLKTCPSGSSQCSSTTAVAQVGDISTKVKVKDCAPACQSGSLNIGTLKMTISCCNTDQCNLQDAPDPSNVPNGKICYTCDVQSCSNILNCLGTEDRCITVTGQSTVLKGCASKSICDARTSVAANASISCCEGNLCNGDQSVTQSSTYNSDQNVTQSSTYNSDQSVTQRSTYNSDQSVTQSSTYNSDQSVTQSSTYNGAQSVSQSFLFLCCSLLSYFLLH
ncbi:phospholipase A2 inhibitor NAI-like [Megalobrama amblycephala]|uniref:phospholipase A2 inhibitor NAI-like n=1 Tax=Megalobrama amblycephala TaxID=75352 RepID=UPI002013D1BB|nr:phospholipase A2 inhibitor NAI-like [Megalobrama amblycephala]